MGYFVVPRRAKPLLTSNFLPFPMFKLAKVECCCSIFAHTTIWHMLWTSCVYLGIFLILRFKKNLVDRLHPSIAHFEVLFDISQVLSKCCLISSIFIPWQLNETPSKILQLMANRGLSFSLIAHHSTYKKNPVSTIW